MQEENSLMQEGSTRQTGINVQKQNIMVGRMISELMRTTLGPRGMDKMLIDSTGDLVITNDGATILKEMNMDHPIGKMMVAIARSQEKEVGDGTTSGVVLAGELLKQAELLINKKIHPTIISRGYKLALDKSSEILKDLAIPIKLDDKKILQNISETAMTGKGSESSKELLSGLVVEAIDKVRDGDNINIGDIKITRKIGHDVNSSKIIDGIVFSKEKVNSNMPDKVENAKIAIITESFDVKQTQMDSRVSITNPGQIKQFLNEEENMVLELIEVVKESGANVVICQKGIDDIAQHFLAKEGIYAVRRANIEDVEKIAKATGAKIISKIKDLTSEHLGEAGLVYEQRLLTGSPMTHIEQCKNPKSVTILLESSTEHIVSEVKRAVEDAIGDINNVIKNKYILGGAGAPEIILSKKLNEYAESLAGREQLAVKAFAEALEIIPSTLAENAGLDPIDVLADMRQMYNKFPKSFPGVNVYTGKSFDALPEGIIEPLGLKQHALSSATEVCIMILRIDDMISSARLPQQ